MNPDNAKHIVIGILVYHHTITVSLHYNLKNSIPYFYNCDIVFLHIGINGRESF